MNVTTLLAALKTELKAQQANTSHTLSNGKINRVACKAALSALINDAFVITDIEYKKIPAAYADVFNLAYSIVEQLEILDKPSKGTYTIKYNYPHPLVMITNGNAIQLVKAIEPDYQPAKHRPMHYAQMHLRALFERGQVSLQVLQNVVDEKHDWSKIYDHDELQTVVDGMILNKRMKSLSVELAKLIIDKAIPDMTIGAVDYWIEHNHPDIFNQINGERLRIILHDALAINGGNQ